MVVRSALIAAGVSFAAATLLLVVGVFIGRGGGLGLGEVANLLTLLFALGLFVGAFAGTRSGVRAGEDPVRARLSGVLGAMAVWLVLSLFGGGEFSALALLGGFVLAAVAAAAGAWLGGRAAATSQDPG